tara:strand:+ start:612 stop:4250 length:3639 start_codon:yes stop_codon:yes gene_type:complete
MTKAPKKIIGSGGVFSPPSPPPPPQPTRTPDTLHSRQFGTFLDLISEGEIEGFATASREGHSRGSGVYNNAAKKDIFLNDTPILKANANSHSPITTDFNYRDVRFDARYGTSNQSKVHGIESSSSTTSVGITVTSGITGEVTRRIADKAPNANPDRARVTITIPQMQEVTDKGDVFGSEVTLEIFVQFNNGGYQRRVLDTIRGRTADAYQKDYSIVLDGTFPVDLRVKRVSPDSTSSNLVNAFQWTSFSEIIDDANRYLDSAYASLRLDSMQFSSIPSRKFKVRGIKVRIPGAGANNSGTPTIDGNTGRIVYPSGYIFNGVMGSAVWTTCPSCILLDLLTDQRYGFGVHISPNFNPSSPSDADLYENLDLFSFVTASKFANEEVKDGFGGLEARFACNANIQSSSSAFNLINEIAGVMRCMPIWSAGSITLTQDSPKDSSYLFNLSNITSDGFNYTGTSLKQRHTAIAVSYFNMDSKEVDFEFVEDSAAQAKFGIITKNVKAFGCTSRGQAARLGKAILFAEQNESELVSFTTSIDSGAVVRPGAIIDIADPVRSGVRRGGRIKAANQSQITVDDDSGATDLADTDNPILSVIMPNGSVERREVQSISNNVIFTKTGFSATPNVNSVWLLENDVVLPQKFRVITVEERDGINYGITALSYIPEKYQFIENDDFVLPERTVSILNLPKPPPNALTAEEKLVVINNAAVSKLIISWQPVAGVTQYQVNYRYNKGNFVSTSVSSPDFEIFNTAIGTYEISVFSFNASLQLSSTSTDITFNAVGKTAVPENVSGLDMEPFSDKLIRLRWNLSTDIDVTHGGFVYVRHSTKTDGTGTFANAVDLVDALPGNSTQAVVPFLEGEYILKFQDDGGRFSKGESSIVLDLPDNRSELLALTRREDNDNPKFQGDKTNINFDNASNSLMLTNPARLVGTYAQSGTTVTITITSHGLTQGQVVEIDYTTGNAVDGDFAVASVTNANVFTVTASAALTTSGDVVVKRNMKGDYEFDNIVDLGGVFSLDLKRHFLTEGFYVGTLFDQRTELIDTWTDFDGAEATDVNAKLLVAQTSTAPSGSSYADSDFTNKPFNTFANGTYKGRAFKFKSLLTTDDPAQNIKITELGFTATLLRRTEQSNVITANGSTNITFTNTFFTGAAGLDAGANSNPPAIGITALNLDAGEFFQLSNITGSGFTIVFKDSGGSPINGKQFTFQAVGFGKG